MMYARDKLPSPRGLLGLSLRNRIDLSKKKTKEAQTVSVEHLLSSSALGTQQKMGPMIVRSRNTHLMMLCVVDMLCTENAPPNRLTPLPTASRSQSFNLIHLFYHKTPLPGITSRKDLHQPPRRHRRGFGLNVLPRHIVKEYERQHVAGALPTLVSVALHIIMLPVLLSSLPYWPSSKVVGFFEWLLIFIVPRERGGELLSSCCCRLFPRRSTATVTVK